MSINEIQKRISRKRRLTEDLLKLAEGLRVKNDHAKWPKANVKYIDDGVAFIKCGETSARAAVMSMKVLQSEDLRGFLAANRQYKPKAEQYLLRSCDGKTALSCVRIEFHF